jgi:hypothetical protein
VSIPLKMYVSSSMVIIASNCGSRQREEIFFDDLTDGAICLDMAGYASMLFERGEGNDLDGFPPT